MLQRGFTTVRDLGGADLGLVQAVEEGLIDGPRLIICGKALSPTGGHGDFRARSDDRDGDFHERAGAMSRIVDGVDALRRACREEVKAGAQFIKLMANGGVASPNDPIHMLGFSVDEMKAAVEEADNAGFYVSAHLYTDRAIARAVDCGVHSLEHCNLIRPETAKRAAEKGCIAVPTLVAYEGLALDGEKLGLGPESVAKIETVRKGGMESLSIMRDAGLPMAFGSDLLGGLMKYHSMEFEILARVLHAGRDHRLGDHRRREALPDGRARSGRSRRAPSPTSSSSTATRSPTSRCSGTTARTCRRSWRGGLFARTN